jgi:hypothetical protein
MKLSVIKHRKDPPRLEGWYAINDEDSLTISYGHLTQESAVQSAHNKGFTHYKIGEKGNIRKFGEHRRRTV